MKYYDQLGDKSVTLGQLMTDDGKVAKVTGYNLLRELINEAISQQQGDLEFTPGCSFGQGSLYTQLSDAAIAQLADVVNQVCNVTFNSAVPMIKTIMEKMQQVIAPDIPVAYATSEILPVIYHPIWNSVLVMDMAARGRNVSPAKVSFAGMILSITDEQYNDLASLATTGLPGIDEQILQIIGQYDGNQLTSLFHDAFVHGFLPSENPGQLLIDGNTSKDQWIILSLWARKLRDIAPKDSVFDLNRYKLNLTTLEEMAARVIAGVDELRQSQSENDLLVMDVRGGNKVFVNNDLYVTFLGEADGGTPEAILGITQLDGSKRQFTRAQVLAEKAQLETAWNRHVSITTARHGQEMQSTARRQLHVILDQAAAEWVVTLNLPKGNLAPLLNLIADEVRKLPSDFLKDLHTWVFAAVGRVFYPNSNVELLLNNLREVGDIKDSGFSAEEIRVMAVINFMGDWLADVITLVEHGGGKGFGDYSLHTPAMALEGLDMPSNLKEWAQLLGLMVLGAGVGYAIGTLLNKLFHGKSKATKAKEAAQRLLDSGLKEISRVDIVAKMEKLDKFKEGISRVFVEMFNDSSDWKTLMRLGEGDVGNVAAYVGELKELLSHREFRDDSDANHFVSKAEALTKKLMAKMHEIANRAKNLAPNMPNINSSATDPEVLQKVEEESKAWAQEAFGKYEEIVPIGNLGRTGMIHVPSVAQDFIALANSNLKEIEGAMSLMRGAGKELDGDNVKALVGYNDQTKAAIDGLKAAYSGWAGFATMQIGICSLAIMGSNLLAAVAYDQKLPD